MIRKGDAVHGTSESVSRWIDISFKDRKIKWKEIPGREFKGIVTLVRRRLGDMYWCQTTDGEEVHASSVELITDEKEAEAIRHRVFVEIPSDRGLEKAKREEAKEKIRKAKRRVVKLKAVMAKQKIFKEEA